MSSEQRRALTLAKSTTIGLTIVDCLASNSVGLSGKLRLFSLNVEVGEAKQCMVAPQCTSPVQANPDEPLH